MSSLRPGPSGDVPDTAPHRALSAVSRVRMLAAVREAVDGLTSAEVAEAINLHPSTVRAHLDQLVESGFLTRDRRSDGSPGRPAWRYRAGPRTEPAGSRDLASHDVAHRDLARALIGHLARTEDDPHGAGVRAGRDWGRSLASPLGRVAPINGLVKVLDQLGFTPKAGPEQDGQIEVQLHSCPYLELAEANPDVVCGVHLGVIGGALGVLGPSAIEADLEPFALPGACVVRLRGRDLKTRPGRGPGRR